jgi:hypothetical protein
MTADVPAPMAASMAAAAPLADVVRRPVVRPTPVPRRTAPPHWQPRGFEVL